MKEIIEAKELIAVAARQGVGNVRGEGEGKKREK